MQFTELQEFVNDFVQRTWHKFNITYGDYMWLLLKFVTHDQEPGDDWTCKQETGHCSVCRCLFVWNSFVSLL